MSIPSRIWRLLRAEINHRLGRSTRTPPYNPADTDETTRGDTRDNSNQYNTRNPAPDDTISRHYQALELPYGASLEEVRAAYIALMKRYHPDKFMDVEKKRLATELVKQINESYAALTKHLGA